MNRDKRKNWWLVGVGCVAVAGLLVFGAVASLIVWGRQLASVGNLSMAAKRGDAVEIKRLIEQGAHVNVRSGTPPLHLAAADRHVEAVRVLLEHGANVDARNEYDGYTALDAAIAGAQEYPIAAEATARLLLSRGADVTLSPPGSQTALEWARQVDATLKRNPQFYVLANSTTSPANVPGDAEVRKYSTEKMESSRRQLVAAILKAGRQKIPAR